MRYFWLELDHKCDDKREMKAPALLLLAAMLLLAGCVAPSAQTINTPSGKPEVTIASADVARIKTSMIGAAINHGFTIESDSQYMLELRGELTGMEQFGAAMAFGNANSVSWKTIQLVFITANEQTRVVGSMFVRTNMPGGQHKSSPITGRVPLASLQANLDDLKKAVEAGQ